jgi:hypothetical protein
MTAKIQGNLAKKYFFEAKIFFISSRIGRMERPVGLPKGSQQRGKIYLDMP